MPQIGAVLVPINYRLTADDFAYIIDHSGATRRLRARRLPGRPSTASATSCPSVAPFRRARRRATHGWLDYEALLAAAPADVHAADDRRDAIC